MGSRAQRPQFGETGADRGMTTDRDCQHPSQPDTSAVATLKGNSNGWKAMAAEHNKPDLFLCLPK